MTLHPEFAVHACARWETNGCAPLEMRPWAVEDLSRRLIQRAKVLGFATCDQLVSMAADASASAEADACLLPNRDGSANLPLSKVEAA